MLKGKDPGAADMEGDPRDLPLVLMLRRPDVDQPGRSDPGPAGWTRFARRNVLAVVPWPGMREVDAK